MKTHAEFGFNWLLEVLHRDGRIEREAVHNLLPDEGRDYLMGAGFKGVGQVSSWFISIFEGNYTPVPGLKAADYPAAATECTAYAGSTRPAFVMGALAGGVVSNSASRAEFAMTADKTVYGGVITSASGKGATSGVLVSAVRFSSPKVLENGAILRVVAANSLASA